MKKSFVFCLVVFLTTNSLIGQQLELTNKTVSNINSRTLYIGVDNEFEIKCETFKGILPKQGVVLTQNKLKISPKTVKNIIVVFLTAEGEIPISFNVKRLPDVYPIVAGLTTKEIIKSSLSNRTLFRLKSFNNIDTFFDNYKVVSFQATLNGSSYKVLGDYFSNELLSAIMNSKNGDEVTISDIKSFNEVINKSVNINGNFEFTIK